MSGERFRLAYDNDADQVVLEGSPAGPAGGADLIPAPGIELLFDCADGSLSRVLVDADAPGGAIIIGEPAKAMIASLFGARGRTAVQQVRQWAGAAGATVTMTARPGVIAALSRLARLDAARLTSPVAQSPWWAVEAAQLAARAGLPGRAAAEARRAASALKTASDAWLGSAPAAVALAVAELVKPADPRLVRRLRDHARAVAPGRPDQVDRDLAMTELAADVADRRTRHDLDCCSANLNWWLDPRMAPGAVFRHALWPPEELTVRAEARAIVVEAGLVPGEDRRALGPCRVRLVDPAMRSVIAAAPFCVVGEYRARAEIHHPVPTAESWAEVVDDADRPVHSGQLHRIRRAMRWADAALRAGRRPQIPGLGERDGLASLAWKRCASDWLAARDTVRARQATAHAANPPRDAPFLAEAVDPGAGDSAKAADSGLASAEVAGS
jgi:hypothetical protein